MKMYATLSIKELDYTSNIIGVSINHYSTISYLTSKKVKSITILILRNYITYGKQVHSKISHP